MEFLGKSQGSPWSGAVHHEIRQKKVNALISKHLPGPVLHAANKGRVQLTSLQHKEVKRCGDRLAGKWHAL